MKKHGGKYPSELAVTLETIEATGEEWLHAELGDDLAAVAEIGKTVRVAIYKLDKIVAVTCDVKTRSLQ